MNYPKHTLLFILMAVVLLTPPLSHANRRNRRKGGISQALQEIIPSDNSLIIEPIQVANLDKISHGFEKSRGEVTREMLNPPPPVEEQSTLEEQTGPSDFPIELQKK